MGKRFTDLSDDLYDYLFSVGVREPELLGRLRRETNTMPMARMQVSPDQGQFMAQLVKLMGARRTLEIGVFTGYSSLCVALALPSGGRIVAFDVSEEWTSIARRFWEEAGVAGKIELRMKDAISGLDELLIKGQRDSYDFAFIDADKKEYGEYFERVLRLIRRGGLIMIDNVLWAGRVLDSKSQEEDTVAIRSFNEKLYSDSRVDISMLPVGDGVTLALKR